MRSPQANDDYGDFAEDGFEYEEYLFSVLFPPGWTIVPIVQAYEKNGVFYLPIMALADGFEFYAGDSEVDRKYVAGFAGDPNTTFALDGINHEITVNGIVSPIDDTAVIDPDLFNDNDLYVRLSVLNQLWPVNMQVDLASLTVYAQSNVEMPFERRKKREDKLAINLARNAEKQNKQAERDALETIDNPWHFFTKPVLDTQTSLTYREDTGKITGTSNLSATHQLGKMYADYTGNLTLDEYGNIREPKNIRFKMSRSGSETEDVFIKGIKKVEAGDVNINQADLIGNGASGRGLILSNKTQRSGGDFDTVTIEGSGPIGWDVEVYNNNELVANGAIDDRGEYRFEDVQLSYGSNQIKTILYGPQGQIRERNEQYNIAGTLLKPNDFKYYAGIVDRNTSLIPLNENTTTSDVGIAQTLKAEYGINKNITAFAGYNQRPSNGETDRYMNAGIVFSSTAGIGEVNTYKQMNNGQAIDTSFMTRFLGMRLNLRQAFFNNFESEDAGFDANQKRAETEINAKRSFRLPFGILGLNLDFKNTQRVSGSSTQEYGFDQSLNKAGWRFNNTTTHRYQDGDHTNSTGRFDTNYRKKNWQYRFNTMYNILPKFNLTSTQFETFYKKDNWQTGYTVGYTFTDDTISNKLQMGYNFDTVLASVDLSHQQNQGISVMLRGTTSIHPFNADNSYRLSSQSRRRSAPVQAKVFLDTNSNSVYDDDDLPLEGIYLERDGTRSQEQTDKDGNLVAYASEGKETAFSVQTRSLDNPYYIASKPGFLLTPRLTSLPQLFFPIVETGSVEGFVTRQSNGRNVSGMSLQLVDEAGKVIGTTETGFDGYYLFEYIPSGHYTVRADTIYTQTTLSQAQVTLTPQDLYALNVDLELIEDSDLPEEGESEGESEGTPTNPHGSTPDFLPEHSFNETPVIQTQE